MTRIEKLREMGIPVNWGTLMAGLHPIGHFPPALTMGDVIDFAVNQLESPDEPSRDLLLLAASSPSDVDSVWRHLRRLEGDFDLDRETHKWRLVLLMEWLSALPAEPLDGMATLTDFWATLDFPADSPHIGHGSWSLIPAQSYYSSENFRNTLKRHYDWVAHEEKRLRKP